MSKKLSTRSKNRSPVTGYSFVSEAGGVKEYKLRANGLRVLFCQRPDTGVITTNITYFVGARDELRGETGVAHMLEHMLFKPTFFDLKNGIKSGGAMDFERKTGCILNANTWKDRTTYFFSYPVEFFERALEIEAERMTGVILTDKELAPEQGNVLSEFDMYNGDPSFALSVQMNSTAFHSHPYGHETIGYREDIESYTADKLERYYRNYYRPDNAVMMVIGDIDEVTALSTVKDIFAGIENPNTDIPRFSIKEPKQEGLRRVSIERESSINIVSIGFKNPGFPSVDWFISNIMLDVLASGPESILHKLLVDSGKASCISSSMEPSSEEGLSHINITLAPNQSHEEIEGMVLKTIHSLTSKDVDQLIKKVKAGMITSELFSRSHSLEIAQELTEYVSSGHWQVYAETPTILKGITTKKVIDRIKQSFINTKMTIGYFIGKE